MREAFALIAILCILYYLIDAIFIEAYKREQSAECVKFEQRYQQKLVDKDGVKYIDKVLVDFCVEKKYPIS